MKLALGTAQFGLPYGVANRLGQLSVSAVEGVLHVAAAAGVDTLDTAIAYGDAELRLGDRGVTGWNIVSKLPAVPEACRDVSAWVTASVRGSLERLRVARLYGLLLHRPGQLLEPGGDFLYRALLRLKNDGVVENIGVSIYDPAELKDLTAAYAFDLVQSPFNLLDRRLVTTGWLARLAAQGTAVHARSVFLQGLLVMPKASRPKRFERWARLWADYDRWLAGSGLTPLQACLRYALSIPNISRVIVGVDSAAQFDAILEASNGPAPQIPDHLGTDDSDLLNPSRWTPS